MKKKAFLLILFFIPSFLFAAHQWPRPSGYFNDFAHVVPPDQAQSLEGFLTEVTQKIGVEIAVVTVPSVEGGDIDRAAVELFKAWGIGKKGKDNGLLILLSIQDRKDRIEVGYGLEGVITDGATGTIRRHDMEPFFKQGNYGQGLINGVMALAQLAAQGSGVTLNGNPSFAPGPAGQEGLGFWGTVILFLILFFILMLLSRRRRRGYWGGGFYGGGWGGGGWSGGGGGGFGGFGGGGSGGGGSSGSW